MTDEQIIEAIKQIINQSPLGYFNQIMSKKHSELRDYVISHSVFLDDKLNPVNNKPYNKATRITYAIFNLNDYPKCSTCGKPIMRNLSANENICKLHCCNKCAQKDPDIIAKIKQTKTINHGDPNYNNKEKARKTCLDKYGFEYSWQAESTKKSIRKTLLERYGVDHQMRSDEIKNAMKARYKKEHGVEYSFQDPKVQAKINAKNQLNYGVDWPMQSQKLRKIMHANSSRTQKIQYFQKVIAVDKEVEPLFTAEDYIKHTKEDYFYEFKWKCKTCGNEFDSRILHGLHTSVAKCPHCNPISKSTSTFEQEITKYIKSLSSSLEVINCKTKINRSIIPPNEIDIIVKQNNIIKLLIEADGLFWHSVMSGKKDKYYHIIKTQQCYDKGYQLIHIFDDEWRNKKDIVKSRLRTLLGFYDKKIFARNCTIKQLTSKESNQFFNETHLQGKCQSSIRYGLFYKNELVSAMSFGKMRRITNRKSNIGEYELLRFSSKLGYHVIGAAGKLLKAFERDFKPTKLLSYADRRWSIGKLYYALGFTLDHISDPNYWYVNSRHSYRMYRYGFRKSQLPKILKKFDPAKTEVENMLDNGYDYIWDCGNYVFVKMYNI